MAKKLTTEEFIENAKLSHGDRYDYSLVEYKNSNHKVKIICKEHGEFLQTPHHHIRFNGCSHCFSLGLNLFIERSKNKFGDKFDYSKVNYISNKKDVIIICPIHGEFTQTPSNHLNGKYGCTECGTHRKKEKPIIIKKNDISKLTFIDRCKNIHGDKYDYSLTHYINSKNKVKIICKEHGEFFQRPSAHLFGQGCMECRLEERRTGLHEFLRKSLEIHGSKYDYSLVNEYINSNTKVSILCKKHGEFNMRPKHHTERKQGCPTCKESIGEIEISKYLDDKTITFKPQHKFDDCKNVNLLPFDFYLPDYNICIEFNGIQHYQPIEFFGGINNFNTQVRRDEIKKEYCYKNNIPLIIIKYDENVKNILDEKLLVPTNGFL